MLLEDLNRYNEAGCRPKSARFWIHILRQMYTHPGLAAVIVYRYGGWVRRCRLPIVRPLCEVVYQFLYAGVRFGLQIEIPRDTAIGPGLRVDHYGGILVNSQATIGRNFTLTKGVLVGATETGVPCIGDDVHCGVDCRIIGGITLGNCVKIGTAAVVTRSFAGNVVIAGIPARALRTLDAPPATNGYIPPAERRDSLITITQDAPGA